MGKQEAVLRARDNVLPAGVGDGSGKDDNRGVIQLINSLQVRDQGDLSHTHFFYFSFLRGENPLPPPIQTIFDMAAMESLSDNN